MRCLPLLAWLVASLNACGHAGRPPADPTAPSAPPAPAKAVPVAKSEVNPQTQVGLFVPGYKSLPALACNVSTRLTALPVVSEPLVIDGVFKEWQKVPGLLDDPSGDALPGLDLTSGKIATSDEDLAIALAYVTTPTSSLNLEFGGVSGYAGKVNRDLRRLLRLYRGDLEQFEGGSWQKVSRQLGAAAVGPDGTELWLSRRLLGDVVVWPAWWLRVFVRDERAEVVADSTQAVYLPSLLATDQLPFTVSNCDLWDGHHSAFGMTEVLFTDGLVDTKSQAQPDPTKNSRSFELMRTAFNASEQAIGTVNLPMARVPILAGLAQFAPMHNSVGIPPAYLGDNEPYYGLTTDTAILADTTEPSPEGASFTDLSLQLLDLQLDLAFPASPGFLREAVRQSLFDSIATTQMGLNFWLDYFPRGVVQLLQSSRAIQSLPLDARDGLSGEVVNAKINAFGHLLATEVGPATLFEAWQRAATRTEAKASVALGRALLGTVQPSSAQKRLQRLWHGWLDSAPFDPLFQPGMVGDSDGDGLPDYYEVHIGTDPLRADSDGDGWSDRAEVIFGTGPNNASSKPEVIMADGDFTDWQVLLPDRLTMVDSTASGCPKAAAIKFFAALAAVDQIVVGAVAADFWLNEPAARWELAIDLPAENRQLLVTANSGEHQMYVYQGDGKTLVKIYQRATAVAAKTMELALDRRDLGITSNLNAANTIKLRLRTVYKDSSGDHLCNQTDWFSPLITGR